MGATAERKAAAEGGCGVIGMAASVPVAGRHLLRSLEQMRNRGKLIACDVADWRLERAGRRLRRAGIDVVNYGSARDSTADSTTILIRRGDSTAAARVRQALGLGRIRVDLDPRLLLDASVLVGPDLARSLGLHP